MGRATIFFTALLCAVAPVPAFAMETADGACEAHLTTLGHVAVAVWIASGVLVLASVAIDLARGRRWSLVAIPLCVIVSGIGLVLAFAEAPLCFG